MDEFEYLFVTGCARSGTTVMANLLRTHPDIAMGRERYARRYVEERHFPPSLFDKDRFCRQLLPGDSHHRKMEPYYEELYPRFDRCRYRGDKVPKMACDYAPLFAFYDRPKIIYMLRNIFDVANSFNLRANDARARGVTNAWRWDRGSAAAVSEWNLSLRNTLEVRDRTDIHFVVYERLFEDDAELIRLFHFLDLRPNGPVAAAHGEFMTEHRKLELGRRISLTSPEKLHIMRCADFESYRRVFAIAEKQT